MVLDVELIDAKEVRVKGGIGKKRKGYKKYNDAINRINLVGWIKEEIIKKSDRTIIVKIDDVAKEMGPEFEEAGYAVMYQALKAILFQNGIFLSMATHKDGDKTFVLRDIREGDRLAPSYLFVKHRIKQEEMLEKEEKEKQKRKEEQNRKYRKEKEEKGIKEGEVAEIEVDNKYSHVRIRKEKERQEKIAMREEIKKLREILHGRLGKKSCMVEIFLFNWNTLTWRMIKRSSARTYLKLLEIVMGNTSNKENRYRIELTPLYEIEDMEGEQGKKGEQEGEQQEGEQGKKGEQEGEQGKKGEQEGEQEGEQGKKGGDIKDIVKKREISGRLEELKGIKEKIEETGETGEKQLQDRELECPRCGSKNIKTWSTVQIIKTRSGDRKLRHRCVDCNETFTDEDIGIR